jgi:hypothetical protein
MTKKKNAGGGNGGLAMTAQTEVDGWVEVFQTNFSNAIIIADAAAAVAAAAAAAADPHQAAEPPGAVNDQLLLQRQRLGEECQTSLAAALALYGQVRPDDEVAAFLAQHDSRFQSQPLPHHHNNSRNNSISAALLLDQPAWIQRDDKRNTSRQLAAQVQTSRNEALALAAEILHHEVATLIQSNKMMKKKKKNSTATAEEASADPIFVNLQIALRDMQEAVAEIKCHMDEWDPMVPQSIHQLAEQLGQIQRGIAVLAAPSQTQDAIDQVLDGLRLECRQQEQLNDDDEEVSSPTEVWATILRRNNTNIW